MNEKERKERMDADAPERAGRERECQLRTVMDMRNKRKARRGFVW